MATEDHDFEEINHANIAGTKFEWKQQSGGAVGAIETNGIDKIIDSLDHYLGSQPGKEKIIHENITSDEYSTEHKNVDGSVLKVKVKVL